MPRRMAASARVLRNWKSFTYLSVGAYLSTTRKIALEDGKKRLINSPRNQDLLPRRSKKGCIPGLPAVGFGAAAFGKVAELYCGRER
jgi:hypothetical protein